MKILLAVLVAVLSLAATLGWRADQARKVAESRIKDLEATLTAKGIAVAPPPPTLLPQDKSTPTTEKKLLAAKTATDLGPYLKLIDDLRDRTHTLDRDLHLARSEESKLQAKAKEQTDQAEKLAEQLATLREESQKDRRIAEVLDVELKGKSQRLIQAETAEKILQDRLTKAEQASRRITGTSKEIEDLNRRRELAITALQRRYREVTDLYRNFALNAQTRETPATGLQAGDLSRIQTALQQAEDDIRQLQTLNARVTELAKAK